MNHHLKLGGRGKTIEINESMFSHKRKYNRGRIGQGMWVFGMDELWHSAYPTGQEKPW